MADQTQQLNRLRSVAAAMPVLDQEAAQRAAAGKALQVDQAIQAAPVGSGVRQAQAIAPQIVPTTAVSPNAGAADLLQAGQAAAQLEGEQQKTDLASATRAQSLAEATQASTQNLTQNAAKSAQQIQMTKAEAEQAKSLQDQGLAYDSSLAFMTQKQRADLADLGRDVKSELFDARLTFEQDANQQKFTSQRQLADYTVASAQSQQDAANKAQIMIQTQQRQDQLYAQAYKVMTQDLQEKIAAAEQDNDQAEKTKLVGIQQQFEQAKADQQKKSSQITALMGGIVSGATTGFMVGGPTGAAVGAGIGAVTALGATQ